MQALTVLEKKISDLIALVRQLETQNAQLVQENVRLKNESKTLEERVLKGTQNVEKLNQEKAVTKDTVSSLIKDIDLLINNG